MNSTKLVKFSLILISTTISLYISEVVLQIFDLKRSRSLTEKRIQKAHEEDIFFDKRSASKVLLDYRKNGIEAYRSLNPQNFLKKLLKLDNGEEIVPLCGISNVITIHSKNETGTRLVYLSDEYGFHNPNGMHDVVNLDIVLIGDSFVQGAAVKSNENVVSSVRKYFPKTLGLGMGGNGPLAELGTFIEYAVVLKPKLIVWVYYEGNDLLSINREMLNRQLTSYLENGKSYSLRDKTREIDAALKNFALTGNSSSEIEGKFGKSSHQRFLDNVKQFILLTKLRNMVEIIKGPNESSKNNLEENSEILGRILGRVLEMVNTWDGELFFLYLPEYSRYSKAHRLSDGAKQYDSIVSLIDSLEITFIDGKMLFDQYDDPMSLFPFRIEGHYTYNANKLIADIIVKSIRGHKGLLSKIERVEK